MYKITFRRSALKEIKKLDKPISTRREFRRTRRNRLRYSKFCLYQK
jgi:mRNA-degrading endonuclease RelE of RelBE toxin-antitoxin system